jgi:glycosyltransferase involved in cell wall biosynthesis/predicted metal-dependent phosphoesterase TrpH
MPQDGFSRADLHCHSSASARSRLGVQRAVGLPECATPPEEVYAQAKRRGMDFVTITDHDTIAGALAIADHADAFVSVELTASFRGEPGAAAHVLCWGITADDHAWLQAHAADVEHCAAYLNEHGIACALAHPYYFVREPLLPRHLGVLAELLLIWETRNGSRAPELNAPAILAADLRGLAGSGGSDDHAGVDIGRSWTQTPGAAAVADFLEHLRAGSTQPGGAQGGATVWAHAPLALAARSLGMDPARPPRIDAVRQILVRVFEGQARESAEAHGLGPQDARDLLVAWVDAVGLARDPSRLVELLQDDAAGHAGLRRRAVRAHERLLDAAARELPAALEQGDFRRALGTLASACIPALPYVATTAFLARERARSHSARREPPRTVALVADLSDGVDGVTRLVDELRERGVPDWEVDVIGTDAAVDRRLPTAVEVELPYYAGRRVGVPSLVGLVDALTSRRYALVHVCSPGPAGVGAALIAELAGLPLIVSHHTELSRYARLRSGRADIERLARAGIAALYSRGRVILSPSSAADSSLLALGVDPARIARWTRGVDTTLFRPRASKAADQSLRVLYAGRLTTEKGVQLLAAAFLAAHARDPRLHLVLAGDGPEAQQLRDQLGARATFLGWLDREALADAHAAADLFCFPSRTDTYGQAVLEALASGLAVVAVGEGGPLDLIEPGRTGVLAAPTPDALADALVELAAAPEWRATLRAGAVAAAQRRTWDAAFAELASGYHRAVSRPEPQERARAA